MLCKTRSLVPARCSKIKPLLKTSCNTNYLSYSGEGPSPWIVKGLLNTCQLPMTLRYYFFNFSHMLCKTRGLVPTRCSKIKPLLKTSCNANYLSYSLDEY